MVFRSQAIELDPLHNSIRLRQDLGVVPIDPFDEPSKYQWVIFGKVSTTG